MRAMSCSAIVLLFALAACSDTPTTESLAGSYEATTFTAREGTGPTEDLIAAGGFIEITLTAAGTTSGTVFVPGGGEGGADFEASLIGTWMLNSESVTFDHDADTFLRDITFTVDGSRLTAEASVGGVTLRVVLEKV